jgi:hypothetical protein
MSIVDLSRSCAAEPLRRVANDACRTSRTHFCLRVGLCVLAFLFPVSLVGFGWWKGIPLQGSMSALGDAF